MTKYVAFLRGINIGGRRVLMDDLQKVFEALGFTDIKTLIASGNVAFTALEIDEKDLQQKIEKALEKFFGFTILVILRTMDEIDKLIKVEPFKRIEIEPGIRLQITFFSADMKSTESIKNHDFLITIIDNRTLASVVYPNGKTTNLMTTIDKTFGKYSTTRNWNTIQKLLKM